MSEVLPPHVYDARVQFSAKRELAEHDTGTNELQLIRDCIVSQPQAFIDEVNQWCPELSNRLLHQASDGIRCHLYRELSQYTDAHESIRDDDFAILPITSKEFERTGDEVPPEPQLEMRVNIEAIERAHEIIGFLFAGKEDSEVVNTRKLQVASGMTAWMALAKWSFDNLDPQDGSPYMENEHIAASLRAAGYSEIYLDAKSEDEVKHFVRDILTDLRYRFVGYFAYKYLKKFSEAHDDMYGYGLDELSVFQKLYPTVYTQLKRYNPRRISTMEYALAQPLNTSQIDRVAAELC